MKEIKETEENDDKKDILLPPFFKNMGKKAELEFDYEINKVKLETKENLNTKMYIIDHFNSKEMRIVNYNEYRDKIIDLVEFENRKKQSFSKAFCLKRLVSKKKRRYEDKEFDLDMTYVTNRVIAMGFPSTGCETVYRNSLKDISALFKKRHNNNVKVYNLCVEKDRIYSKDLFPFCAVTLFPSKDHNPCPIKMILEFCVDIVLYLINNPTSVAAVHCKAGKGRTGVMICSYLVFSGLCSSSEEAFEYYAKVRTYNSKGVTIPSQKRYVKYFESFLQTNLCKPYVHMIPQIIKYHCQDKTKNILSNFMTDERYFVSPNNFHLKKIRIGPLSKKLDLSIAICNFIYKPLEVAIIKKAEQSVDGRDFFFIFEFQDQVKIDSDIKIEIKGGLDFYIWVNLWYSTLEIIRTFVERHHTEKEEDERVKQQDLIKRKKSERKVEIDLKAVSKKKDGKTENKSQNSTKITKENREKEDQDKSDRSFVMNDNEVFSKKIENFENTEPDVFQIIDSLDHSTNLNKILSAVNEINQKKSRPLLNTEEFNIYLNAYELDKFEEVKKMKDGFKMEIFYSMYE